MLQNAIYSVISPEGCATILWRDPKKTLEAATAMKMSSKDLLNLDIIDEIIPEPIGGAHRDKDLMLDNVRNSLEKNLRISSSILQEEYRKHSFLIGRSIRVKEKDTVYEGIAVDIAQDGGLIVLIVDEENPRKLIAAEVSILPNY